MDSDLPENASSVRPGLLSALLTTQYGPRHGAGVHSTLRDHYNGLVADTLWPKLAEIFKLTAAPPQLAVVYSMQSMPRFFSVSGTELLVYDQHLGQVLTQLTRLTVLGIEPELVDAYLAKLFALRFFVRGRLVEAGSSVIMYAQRAEELRAAWRPSPADRASVLRLQPHHVLGDAQERFVLAHELAHHVQRVEPGAFAELEDDMRDVLDAWVASCERQPEMSEFHKDEYFTSAEKAWERRHGPLDDDVKKLVRERALPEGTLTKLSPGAHARSVRAAIEENPTLRTEVACDTMAMLAVMFSSATAETLSVDIAGAALALHHLRLLQFIDDVADGRSLGASYSLDVHASIQRLSAFRACTSGFAMIAFGEDSGVAQHLHEQVTRVNLDHAEVIGDQFLFHTQQTMARLVDVTPSAWEGTPESAVDWDGIRSLLGF
ncbi:MAG: hypothetical protein ACTHOK_15185 [Nocardioidaceae bacterium]